MFDPNKDYNFFKYPVFYQQQNGYLVFSCPDLHIMLTTDLPSRGQYDSKYAVQLAKAMGEMELKIRNKLKDMKAAKIKAPYPSKVKTILNSEKIRKLTTPQVAKLIGKSVNTTRRWADKGLLKCEVTEGGTRYFLEKDVVDFVHNQHDEESNL